MPFKTDLTDQELMKQIVGFYHETLKQSPEALAYLEKRGLKNSEMIDRFQLGYSNRTLCYRLPERGWATSAAMPSSRTSEFCGKAATSILPVRSSFRSSMSKARWAGMYGRKIVDDQADVLMYHMYLPGPHKGVWNSEALSASKDVILCEALIDALTFWCAGFRNVTASYGVNGFTADHLSAFKKNGIQRVFITYDHDKAGIKEADKLADELIVEGFECFRVLFPRNMDANEYALRVKPPEKSLDLLIRNAAWMGRPAEPLRAQEAAGIEDSVSSEPEKEPKAATKGKNMPGEIPDPENSSRLLSHPEERGGLPPSEKPEKLETLSQPSEKQEDIFPLAAEKSLDSSPKPARAAPKNRRGPRRFSIRTRKSGRRKSSSA